MLIIERLYERMTHVSGIHCTTIHSRTWGRSNATPAVDRQLRTSAPRRRCSACLQSHNRIRARAGPTKSMFARAFARLSDDARSYGRTSRSRMSCTPNPGASERMTAPSSYSLQGISHACKMPRFGVLLAWYTEYYRYQLN